MRTVSATNGGTPNKHGIPLLLALIAAGLAGNYFKYPIFLNIDFLFGSIFAMLALQFFGFGRGVLAAAMIAGYTYLLWNHPYAIIIMIAEVAVVGWLMIRRKIGMAVADTLYWLFLGMPLVYLFYHLVMHVPPSSTYIIMTKQAMNGIANAVVARLLFTAVMFRNRSRLFPLHEIISNLLIFFILLQSLVMLAITSRKDFAETDRHIRTNLTQASHRLDHFVATWLNNRKTAIIHLAEMAASRSPQQMQVHLEQAKKSDVNFNRIGIMNKDAITVAYFPMIDELGKSNIGKSYADRTYIPTLQQTLQPMLSEVVISRIGIPKPTVGIFVPVVIRGEYGGYITGNLNLEQIKEQLDRSIAENASLYTLLDKKGKVILTNRTDQKVMAPFTRGKGALTALDKNISQWIPPLPPNTPISERWKKSLYVAETIIGDFAEWKLILEQPVAPFQKKLYESYTGKLTILFLILLVVMALAELLSRRSIHALEKLRLITHDLPVKLVKDEGNIAWPESSIQEIHHLIDNFREMADVLSGQFIETRQINESLEWRVQERTAALEIVNAELVAQISEREQTEEQLLIAKAAAESANTAKSQFLANMSHEIRTPMNGILGMTQLLETTALTQEQQDYVTSLKLTGNNLISLISDILDLAKIEAGKTVITMAEFSLNQCITDIVLMQRFVSHDKGLALDVKLSEDIPQLLVGDQLRVKQILLNLLNNAVKFTSQGGITLSTQLIEQHETSVLVRIAVRDTGIGISPEGLESIFKPFTQEDGSIDRKYGGTGLGLTISLRLAELLGGTIDVESSPGAGSCFTVTLPFTIGTTVMPSRFDFTPPAIDWDGPPLRVLLVEDDQVNINFGTALLKKLGHEAVSVVNGRECLTALENGTFDLVLMDIQMPVMNGEDTLREIRKQELGTTDHLPVLALTAYSMRGDRERLLEEGFDGYVSKPLFINDLVAEMKRVLGTTEGEIL